MGGVVMSGGRRRVAYGSLAGVLLQSCAGWVLWSGYTDAVLVQSLMAGAVVLNSLWRSGTPDRTPPPPAPDGVPGELSELVRIVLYGVANLPGRSYPPPGHGYPRL